MRKFSSWGSYKDRVADETRLRIDLGFQCPECYGVRIQLMPRLPHDLHEYQCEECGCQWSRR